MCFTAWPDDSDKIHQIFISSLYVEQIKNSLQVLFQLFYFTNITSREFKSVFFLTKGEYLCTQRSKALLSFALLSFCLVYPRHKYFNY